MKYDLIKCPFYLIQMLWGRAQLFLTNPRSEVFPWTIWVLATGLCLPLGTRPVIKLLCDIRSSECYSLGKSLRSPWKVLEFYTILPVWTLVSYQDQIAGLTPFYFLKVKKSSSLNQFRPSSDQQVQEVEEGGGAEGGVEAVSWQLSLQ